MMSALLARALIALVLLAGAAACKNGPPDCAPGFFPQDGVCVPFGDNGDAMPRGDGGVDDTGPAYPDASDAGFPEEEPDGSIYDSGHVEVPPVVTLGERGRILLTGSAVLAMASTNPIA